MATFAFLALSSLFCLLNAASLLPNGSITEDYRPRQLAKGNESDPFDWSNYQTLPKIETWLDQILEAYPTVTEGFSIGKSYEGRSIRGLKISYKSGNPGVFIESNIHAREWITSATATWLINELLSSPDPLVRELAEGHDWYIIPVLNVDGFVYSHTTDRDWRKNRQPSPNSDCIGVDPNRNFGTHWMENNGSSSDPCDVIYAGAHPYSAAETNQLNVFVSGIRQKLNVFLSFHSFGQLILTPYCYTADLIPDNNSDLLQLAGAFSRAVQSLPHGTYYKYGLGSATLLQYVASGSSLDWAYIDQGIKLAFTLEMRDVGVHGFVLPREQIVPNAEEVLAGITAMLLEAKELGYLQAINAFN